MRLEDTESRQVELRVYTTNTGSDLQMPIGDSGGGMFVGRYGTVGLTFESGSICAWHPIRNWDRFSDFNDHPEMCHWTFTTEFRDAFIKRVWWEEGQAVQNVNVRAVCRLNESVQWNAKASRVIPLSQDGEGDQSGGGGVSRRRLRGDPLRYLYSMEVPDGDNLILLQADKVEVRMLVIFEQGAFRWDDMSAAGWKGSPKIEVMGIEYVQQNRVLRHIDR